jgi:hypothetical protein
MYTEIIGNIQELESSRLDMFYYKECNGVYLVNNDLLEIIATPKYCKQIKWFTERVDDSAICEYRTRIDNKWSKWIRVYEDIYEGQNKADNKGIAGFDDLDEIIDRVNIERRYDDTSLRNSINNYVESPELGNKLSRKVSQPRHPNNTITFKGPLRISENLYFYNEPWNSGGTMGVLLDGTYRFFSFHGGHQGRIQFGNEHTKLVSFRAGKEDTLVLHNVAGNGDTFEGNRWVLTTPELDWKTFWDGDPSSVSYNTDPIDSGFRPGDGDREIQVTQYAAPGRGGAPYGKHMWFNVHGPDYTLLSHIIQTVANRGFNYEPAHNARYANRELRRNYGLSSTYQYVKWIKLHWR